MKKIAGLLAAAVLALPMMPGVALADEEIEVELHVTVAPLTPDVCIAVDPGEIDFGEVEAGSSEDGGKVKIENCGNVPIDISASLKEEIEPFESGLKISGRPWNNWEVSNLEPGKTTRRAVRLDVPAETEPGEYNDVLIFEASEHT